MREYIITMEGYERETGRSFEMVLRVAAPSRVEARMLTLEEALAQKLSIAVVLSLEEVPEESQETVPRVLSLSPRQYLLEVGRDCLLPDAPAE